MCTDFAWLRQDFGITWCQAACELLGAQTALLHATCLPSTMALKQPWAHGTTWAQSHGESLVRLMSLTMLDFLAASVQHFTKLEA